MPRSRIRTLPAKDARGTPHRRRAGRYGRGANLHRLIDWDRCLPTSLDLDSVFHETTRGAATLMGAAAASLWRLDEAAGLLQASAFWSTTSSSEVPPQTLPLAQDAIGWVAQHRQLLNVANLDDETRFVALDCWRQSGWRSFLGLPILIEDRLFAVLACHDVHPFILDDEAQQLLHTFIARVSTALQHAILYAAETTARRAAETSAYAQASLAVRQASLYAAETVARAAIEEATRAKSTLLGNMSHEFRTPLNAIINYSELLQEEVIEQGHLDYVADLQKIHAAGKRLLGLITDILDFARIDSGNIELHHETFHVPCMVRDMVATLQPLLVQHANTVEVHIAADVATLYTDKLKVHQSLLQLLSNACKFTSQGHIVVTVEYETFDDHRWICFQVRDTGIGISPAQLAKLFQPFTQGDDKPTRKYGGTGLGLAIGQRLCQLMGGEISVVSTLGQGSLFTMHLPVHTDPSLARE